MTALPVAGTTVEWANPPASSLPRMVGESPGPRSQALHTRMERHQRGSYTAMVALRPVAFESGRGAVLRDVDGNEYIDFSSGIVVTNLGHAHPRISAAIAAKAGELDNVHDFATPIKVEAMEALASVTPPGMTLFTFFCAGTEAVEGAMRVARAATGRQGFIGFFGDYHGRTSGAAGITAMGVSNGIRPPGSLIVPGGHYYRCPLCGGDDDATTCTHRSIALLDEAISQNQPGQIAAVVIEVITNSSGARVYPPEYVPAVADLCRR